MKKFIFNIAIAAGLVTGFASCEDFLDRVPTESVVAESAMVTIADAKVAANGLYTDLKYYSMYGTNIPCFGDVRGDNFYPRVVNGSWATIYALDFGATQNNYFGMWQNYYNVIMKASTIIANIETVPAESASDKATKEDINSYENNKKCVKV